MREIKFRAWNRAEKFMDTAWLIDWEHDAVCHRAHNESDLNDCELMQYTGLKDKNGKEIYLNSDYVKLTVWHGEAQPYTTYHDGAFDISDYAPPTKYEYEGLVTETEFGAYKVDRFYLLNLEGADAYSFEIVGNIYENPELLIRHKS